MKSPQPKSEGRRERGSLVNVLKTKGRLWLARETKGQGAIQK